MAENKGDQGTGKHPHKSTEEPYPHHEGKSTKGEGHESKSASSHSGESSHSGGSSRSSGSKSESEDLKSREYRDEHGNVHHHTHTAGKSKE